MANWCSNDLYIYGEPEEIKRFLFANIGFPASPPPEGEVLTPRFCFNACVPVGATFDPDQDEIAAEELWGTKWDIYRENLTHDSICLREDDTSIVLSFDTAWSPPSEWLKKVASMHPSVILILHYEESGFSLAGDIVCKGDIAIENEYDEEKSKEVFRYIQDDSAEPYEINTDMLLSQIRTILEKDRNTPSS